MVASSYGEHIQRIRPAEVPDMEAAVYLDSSGMPVVPRSVLRAVHQRLLQGHMIANPHSSSPSGKATKDEMDQVRTLVCRQLFGVERSGGRVERDREAGWELVFTSGTTASLQSVANNFDFGRLGKFAYLEQSHSSLFGLRDVVKQRGAKECNVLREEEMVDWVKRQSRAGGISLLALPLQCNATGKRYNRLLSSLLEARREAESMQSQRKVYILVDAASYLSPSTNLPLGHQSLHRPDFICFSFLKILGYPSGLGGLLVLRQSGAVLLAGKQYHGGGSLEAVTSRRQWKKPSEEIHEALEDGTPNLFGIAAVKSAMETLRSDLLLKSWEEASDYVDELTRQLWAMMKALKHGDGSDLVEVYSEEAQTWSDDCSFTKPRQSQGPILLFNVLRPACQDGNGQSGRVDPAEVDRLACVENIHLRSGRMCNVGAITTALQLDERDIEALWERGIGCGSVVERQERGGQGRIEDRVEEERLQGLVSSCLRVSLSAWNTAADLDQLASFLQKYFWKERASGEGGEESEYGSCSQGSDVDSESGDDQTDSQTTCDSNTSIHRDQSLDCEHFLAEVHLYPIKSCGHQALTGDWKLTPTGLEHDRQFCIIDIGTGRVMSQKQVPKMARIRPRVCLETRTMHIALTDEQGNVEQHLSVPLDGSEVEQPSGRGYDMCGKTLTPLVLADDCIRTSLTAFLARDCTLARYANGRGVREHDRTPLLFSNESPFLLISSESVGQVCRWIDKEESEAGSDTLADERNVGLAFRSNLIIASRSGHRSRPFYEQDASRVKIGPHSFAVMGPCRRCQMIALDQTTGLPAPRVLSVVAKHCRSHHGKLQGRLLFGIHLFWAPEDAAPSVVPTIKAGMPVTLV